VAEVDTLQQLAEVLNDISEELHDKHYDLSAVDDICDLPTFGGAYPDRTSEVWSWDQRQILTGDGNGKWIVPDRCKCGEATFHCKCEQDQ
jgi:hypothetical protein